MIGGGAGKGIFLGTPGGFRAGWGGPTRRPRELWLGPSKKGSGRRSLTWSEVVDEALCFGWIDGKRQRIDEHRFRQRLSPRRRNSNWSALNVAKVAELRAHGRMTPAGEAAFAARREDPSGTLSYERRHEAAFDAEQEAAFRANASGGSGSRPNPVRIAAWRRSGCSAPNARRRAPGGSRR